MNHLFNKKISKILGAGMLGVLISLSFSQRASAQLPVVVPVGDLVRIQVHDVPVLGKEFSLDGLINALSKQIISQMTAGIVDWINSGFDGNPAFITDFGGFLQDVGDEANIDFFDDYSKFIEGAYHRDFVLEALNKNMFGNFFSEKNRYDLDQIVDDVDSFVSGNFSEGGWEGWLALTQKPQNNPIGALTQATQEADQRKAAAESIETTKLSWGNGFLSLTDSEGNIITPGSIIKDQLDHHLGTPLRQLELADEFNEILGALMNQLTGNLFSINGLLGLSSSSGSDSSGNRIPSFTESLANEDIENEISTGLPEVGEEFEELIPELSNSGDNSIAFNKPANQYGQSGNNIATHAVDGNKYTQGSRATLAISDSVPSPWWQVDLGSDHSATRLLRMEIYRHSGQSYLNSIGSFRVLVSHVPFPIVPQNVLDPSPTNPWVMANNVWVSQVFDSTNVPTTGVITIPLDDVSGRYVRIQRISDGNNRRLRLAEVLIYGEEPDAEESDATEEP